GNTEVDKVYDNMQEEAKKISGPFDETTDTPRHYLYEGVKTLISSVTQYVKKLHPFTTERTTLEKFLDDQKAMWGTTGHKYLDNFITENLIDSKGYALPKFKETPVATDLPSAQQKVIQS